MKKRKIASLLAILSIISIFAGCSKVQGSESTYLNGTASGLQYQYLSGEIEALQYQTYNLATEKLKNIVKDYKGDKRAAIVLDLDETVLNNYGSEIDNFTSGKGYNSAEWNKWVMEEKATIIPGADEFLNSAHELDVEIYYITNRTLDQQSATIDNLKKLGLPDADTGHVITKADSSDKISRVNKVKETNNIIMFVGDNLGDFPSDFYNKSNIERKAIVEANKEKFGAEYIILPNSVYGDWDSATFNYDYKKTDEQKTKDRIDALNNYKEQEANKVK